MTVRVCDAFRWRAEISRDDDPRCHRFIDMLAQRIA
jgi:hypothetical protein